MCVPRDVFGSALPKSSGEFAGPDSDDDTGDQYIHTIVLNSDDFVDDIYHNTVDNFSGDDQGGRDVPTAFGFEAHFLKDQSTTSLSCGFKTDANVIAGLINADIDEGDDDMLQDDCTLLAPATSAMELDLVDRLKPPASSSDRKPKGPGGAVRQTRTTPCRVITALKVDGVVQVDPTKGVKKNADIFKKHITKLPHERKWRDGAVNPLLQVSKVVLLRSEYVAIAREMWPKTKKEGVFVEKTATKNLAKFLCENAMNSDTATSKRLGLYTLTFNVEGFDDTAFKLMKGGNPSCGRPDFHITVV